MEFFRRGKLRLQDRETGFGAKLEMRLVYGEGECPFVWALVYFSGAGAAPVGDTFLQPLTLSCDSSHPCWENTVYFCHDAVNAPSCVLGSYEGVFLAH